MSNEQLTEMENVVLFVQPKDLVSAFCRALLPALGVPPPTDVPLWLSLGQAFWNLGSDLPVQQKQPWTSGRVYGLLRENESILPASSLFTCAGLRSPGYKCHHTHSPKSFRTQTRRKSFLFYVFKELLIFFTRVYSLPKMTNSGNSLQPNLCLTNCKDVSSTHALDRTVTVSDTVPMLGLP